MSEELVINAPTITDDAFDGGALPPEERTNQPEAKIETPIIKEEIKIEDKITETPPVEDGRKFLKEKLGYEDWDTAKAELEVLKSKKDAPEVKQEPIDAAKIKEYYSIIDKKERLEKLTEGDVTESNASAIIKASFFEKYKGLTQDQINYKFNKQFATPKEPVIGETEDADDFEIRHNEWKQQAADIKMDMLIEANLARPELEKIKSELLLPTIPQTTNTQKVYTSEELAEIQKGIESFVQNASATVDKFEGFNVAYKDKDVDIQSTYTLSDEEKQTVKSQLKTLAEDNYNANVIFAQRWVNDDNTYNFSQMAKDLAILETYDKTAQKFVSDAATKATVGFIKQKHNIDLNNGNGGGQLELQDTDLKKKQEDAIWN